VTTHYVDEAEYCQRVGIMSQGRLLAMEAPETLKAETLSGLAWDVFAEPLLPSLDRLGGHAEVLRAGLAGDHLRAITRRGLGARELAEWLTQSGARQVHVERAEPSLEDVFIALAGASASA
jgi:ABC-2 type transport system ATP-binding protein